MTPKVPPLTPMICAYPDCPNMVWITVKQKRELKTDNVLKYGTSSDVYCSIECQQKHLRELSESEFLMKGTLKNREYALVIHGADVTKRPKEKEVHILTGNTTSQRAGCLYQKLLTLTPVKKRRLLTSNEVKEFLINDLPDKLKVKGKYPERAAYDVMDKTKELYPDAILIESLNEKSRYIEIMK